MSSSLREPARHVVQEPHVEGLRVVGRELQQQRQVLLRARIDDPDQFCPDGRLSSRRGSSELQCTRFGAIGLKRSQVWGGTAVGQPEGHPRISQPFRSG